jgi:hypothetical protein
MSRMTRTISFACRLYQSIARGTTSPPPLFSAPEIGRTTLHIYSLQVNPGTKFSSSLELKLAGSLNSGGAFQFFKNGYADQKMSLVSALIEMGDVSDFDS